MPILDARHDLAHPVEQDSAWSESYYFNCYDPVSDTGFFTRIGVRPNERTIDSHFAAWLPGGDVAHVRHVGEIDAMIEGRLEVGPVTYVMDDPMQRWRINVDGEAIVQRLDRSGELGRTQLAAELGFEALTPAIGVDGQGSERTSSSSRASSATVGKGHLEQAGRWTGRLSVDGIDLHLGDARGNRDKSWGPRRWGGPTMWRWFSINIGGESWGEGTHLGGIRIGSDDAADLHRGWVWRDGEHASVSDWQLTTELEDDDLTQRVVHLNVEDKAGRTTNLRGDLLRVAPLPRKQGDRLTLVNEGLSRWTLLDGPSSQPAPPTGHSPPTELAIGFGIAEYLHQLDEQGMPVRPVE